MTWVEQVHVCYYHFKRQFEWLTATNFEHFFLWNLTISSFVFVLIRQIQILTRYFRKITCRICKASQWYQLFIDGSCCFPRFLARLLRYFTDSTASIITFRALQKKKKKEKKRLYLSNISFRTHQSNKYIFRSLFCVHYMSIKRLLNRYDYVISILLNNAIKGTNWLKKDLWGRPCLIQL